MQLNLCCKTLLRCKLTLPSSSVHYILLGMAIPRLAIYASINTTNTLKYHSWKYFQRIKDAGFRGIQAPLSNKQDEQIDFFTEELQHQDLKLIVDLELQSIDNLKLQFDQISSLGDIITHINCKPCFEQHDRKTGLSRENIDFYSDVLSTSAQFLEEHSYIGKYGRETDIMGNSPHHLTGISHDTLHHGIFGTPSLTREMLEVLPPFRLTASIWEWYRDCMHWGHDGNVYEGEDTEEVLQVEIVPHFDHIHVLYGNDLEKECKVAQRELWYKVWSRKATRNVEEVSITPYILGDNSRRDLDNEVLWSEMLKAKKDIEISYELWSDGCDCMID